MTVSKNASSISPDSNCSAADVSQVGALTPAMWLISSGSNRDATFDSVLTLQSSDVPRGRFAYYVKKDFRVGAGKRGDLTEKLRSALRFNSERFKIHSAAFFCVCVVYSR